MKCVKCGYEFFEGIFCPECGTKHEKIIVVAVEREKNVEDVAVEEDRNIVESEKPAIREKAEGKERDRAIKTTQEEKDKKGNLEKVINRKAIMSLVLGIFSWISLLSMILIFISPVASIWSIVDGIKSIKSKTKYKKSAIMGIFLSIIYWVLIISILIMVYFFEDDSTQTSNPSSVIKEMDIESEEVIEADTDTKNNNEEIVESIDDVNIEGKANTNTEEENYTKSIDAENSDNDSVSDSISMIEEAYGVDMDLYSVENFPYQNSRKASKLIKVYQEAKNAKETDFTNVESERKGIFDSSMQYVQTLSEGDYMYYGEMKNGKPNGEGLLLSYDSSTGAHLLNLLGEFKDGQLNGYVIWFSSFNGLEVASEGNYSKGERDGEYFGYYNGMFDENYLQDNVDFLYAYQDYVREQILADYDTLIFDLLLLPVYVQEKGEYNNGKPTGKWFSYFSDGTTEAEVKFNRDGESGEGSIYYSNGNLKYKGEFKDMLYHGKGTLYREDGSIEYKGKFEKGNIKAE